jgi:hypothetical protein
MLIMHGNENPKAVPMLMSVYLQLELSLKQDCQNLSG